MQLAVEMELDVRDIPFEATIRPHPKYSTVYSGGRFRTRPMVTHPATLNRGSRWDYPFGPTTFSPKPKVTVPIRTGVGRERTSTKTDSILYK